MKIRVQKTVAAIESNNAAGIPTTWLSNLLPAGREEMTETSTDTTPTETPTHQATGLLQSPFGKPVNLLPEGVHQTGNKLSEREQRDCEVIGK